MGYHMSLRKAKFLINKELQGKALKAIKELAGSETISDSSGAHFSWVDTEDFLKARHIEDAFNAWRWEVCFDDADNINDIEFLGEKLGDDIILFEAIAPFVSSGSYIEMVGEDGNIWRWSFRDGRVKEFRPKIIYEE